MMVETLAFVIRVEDRGLSDEQKCAAVWSKAVETLLPQMGTWYDRFQPAGTAWHKAVRNPFGVVLGNEQPAFMQFYALAKKAQEKIVLHNLNTLERLAGGVKNLGTFQDGRISICSMESAKGMDLVKRIVWQDEIIDGKLVPGAVLHYCADGDKQFDHQTDARILGSPQQYALCLVDIITSEKE